jgi:hypothetical protein
MAKAVKKSNMNDPFYVVGFEEKDGYSFSLESVPHETYKEAYDSIGVDGYAAVFKVQVAGRLIGKPRFVKV